MQNRAAKWLAFSALALALGASSASAQQGYNDQNGPPPGYQNGPPPDDSGPPPPPGGDYGPPPPPPGGDYGPPPPDNGPPPPDAYGAPPPPPDCHNQNAGTGTVLGAIAGGIIGSQFGHGGGRAAATVGGVVVGGVIGNKIAGDMDCEDQQYAMPVYRTGLDGNIGQRYDWRDPRGHYGYFTPTREYHRHHRWCRDFEEGVWRHGQWDVNTGTACRYDDGWHFM